MEARDRERMRQVAASLAGVETDVPPSPEALAGAVRDADRDRARSGRDPLAGDLRRPEEELYARARALGLRRIRR